MAQGYSSRKSGNRKEFKTLVIVSEGETERVYFRGYKQRKSGLYIIIPNSTETDPVNLVNLALRQIVKYDLDLENGDQVWCVFDADRNTNENIQRALARADDKVKLCLSNPCFELWYLLHFGYFDGRISTGDMQNKIETHIRGYDKVKDYFGVLLSKRDAAVRNSKKLVQKHEESGTQLLSIESNPSTNVFDLVEYILEVINRGRI